MKSDFLLYGSTGAVGKAIARLAVANDLYPLLAGRNPARLKALAGELGLEYRAFELADAAALDAALREVPVVLHCAGPYTDTFQPMLDGCLRTRVHYLDLTGEIPVYTALAGCDAEARERGVMLLPGAGIEVVATDCLALHLKRRLPSAIRLALAFKTEGPVILPPGTFKSYMEMVPYWNTVRQDGKVVQAKDLALRMIDYGGGEVRSIRLPYPDVFTAYYSTGIPNIEDYGGWPEYAIRQIKMMVALRSLFKLKSVRELFKRGAPAEPNAEDLAQVTTHVWGEAQDAQGRTVVSRLHGPEGGITWTSLAALTVLRKVLAGNIRPGFATPALAYGPDLVLEAGSVTCEDVG